MSPDTLSAVTDRVSRAGQPGAAEDICMSAPPGARVLTLTVTGREGQGHLQAFKLQARGSSHARGRGSGIGLALAGLGPGPGPGRASMVPTKQTNHCPVPSAQCSVLERDREPRAHRSSASSIKSSCPRGIASYFIIKTQTKATNSPCPGGVLVLVRLPSPVSRLLSPVPPGA